MNSPSDAPPAIARALLDRLPRTFLPVLNDQLHRWRLLFPAEQRPVRATLDYLAALPPAAFDELLAPVKLLEARMDLSGWNPEKERLSIEDTSVLARSPLYPRWRAEVEKLFEKINPALPESGQSALAKAPKLIACTLPADLPIETQPLWPRLVPHGRWIQLERPFSGGFDAFVSALASRPAPPGSEPVERTWILESLSCFAGREQPPGLTVLSYEELAPARNEFRRRMNEIEKDLRAADETFDGLRHMKMEALLGPALDADVRLREFIRGVFLSGNGAVLFNNSFVQWGASEVLRRVQPQALVCSFGIRQKLKPYSSLVLFEDQDRASPVPGAPDPAGSLTDIQLLCDYVYLAAENLPAYRRRTLHLFAALASDLLLLVPPPDFPARTLPATRKITLVELTEATLAWLGSASPQK